MDSIDRAVKRLNELFGKDGTVIDRDAFVATASRLVADVILLLAESDLEDMLKEDGEELAIQGKLW